MKKDLLKIAIRHNAIYLPDMNEVSNTAISDISANLVANLIKLGYTVDEPLLHRLNDQMAPDVLAIYEAFLEVLQVKNNWMPLVKGWDIPTGEKRTYHWTSLIANMFHGIEGERLACGHLIPFNSFPLDRYNGCPFCGKPFLTNGEIYQGQGSKMKLLTLFTNEDLQLLLNNLLQSKTPLDATQVDSLKVLLRYFDLPDITIPMKETQMLVIDALKEAGKTDIAGKLFTTPADILRYLWYKHTGFLQLVQPAVIVKRTAKNSQHIHEGLNRSVAARQAAKNKIKLKYSRAEARIIAQWINNLPLEAEKSAAFMHPQRAIWVRFIRALRLAEYSKYKGMERLQKLMDVFYNKTYEVEAGRIEYYKLKGDAVNTFQLLQQRPGLFSRSLFANILWFGEEKTLAAFESIADQVPARLLVALSSYAKSYFDVNSNRVVKPLGGTAKMINANKLLALYERDQLIAMADAVEQMCWRIIKTRFASEVTGHKTIFIDSSLYYMPLPVGDRSETIQDLPAALIGTRFPVEGDTVRLFMQWGKGLAAQHLDMDLSCQVIYGYKTDVCNYSSLSVTGAWHSGDIRSIPAQVGTAEYIDLDIDVLQQANARYVSFTCNAYSNGSIVPNLVIGWMNSAHSMKISEKTGVAYDASCVQQQVKITQSLTKGLLFGVLDVVGREIIWLEQSFGGQTVHNLSVDSINAMLEKLKAKTTVGRLLDIKAAAQGLTRVQEPESADESYTRVWAMDIARITQVLPD